MMMDNMILKYDITIILSSQRKKYVAVISMTRDSRRVNVSFKNKSATIALAVSVYYQVQGIISGKAVIGMIDAKFIFEEKVSVRTTSCLVTSYK